MQMTADAAALTSQVYFDDRHEPIFFSSALIDALLAELGIEVVLPHGSVVERPTGKPSVR